MKIESCDIGTYNINVSGNHIFTIKINGDMIKDKFSCWFQVNNEDIKNSCYTMNRDNHSTNNMYFYVRFTSYFSINDIITIKHCGGMNIKKYRFEVENI